MLTEASVRDLKARWILAAFPSNRRHHHRAPRLDRAQVHGSYATILAVEKHLAAGVIVTATLESTMLKWNSFVRGFRAS